MCVINVIRCIYLCHVCCIWHMLSVLLIHKPSLVLCANCVYQSCCILAIYLTASYVDADSFGRTQLVFMPPEATVQLVNQERCSILLHPHEVSLCVVWCYSCP